MKTLASTIMVCLLALFQSPFASAQDALTIGHFNEWPLPAHYGQSSGAYDEVLGAETEWRAFDSSTSMFAALENGDIQIALSQGVVPFLQVATAGMAFDVVDIAVSYADNENCVAHHSLGFSSENASVLVGKTVALPFGTTAHYNLLRQLAHFNINPASVHLLNMSPTQAAAALRQEKADIACGWGPALNDMLTNGVQLTSANLKTELGGGNFDLIVVRSSFGTDNPEVVAQFLKVTADLNASFTANPARMIAGIASPLNMTEEAVKSSMAGFQFPTINEKTGATWLGGGVETYLKDLADFFVEHGTIDEALGSYAENIDISYLQAAMDLPLVPSE